MNKEIDVEPTEERLARDREIMKQDLKDFMCRRMYKPEELVEALTEIACEGGEYE